MSHVTDRCAEVSCPQYARCVSTTTFYECRCERGRYLNSEFDGSTTCKASASIVKVGCECIRVEKRKVVHNKILKTG